MLISIIIPVFNSEKYLPGLLENLKNQSFRDFEVVFQEAISADSSAELIRRAALTDDRIRMFRDKDLGIYDAMNRAIPKARGEWLYFMGSDDRLSEHVILETISPHLSEPFDIVYGDVLWVPGDNKETGECNVSDLVHRNINHQRIFYRKTLFQKYGAYDLKYSISSDYELNIRFFCNKKIRAKYIHHTIAYYNSTGFTANKIDDAFWNDWKFIFRSNMLGDLKYKDMYAKLGWYCRHLIDRREYSRALPIFFDVFFHTLSPGFLLLTGRHLLRSFLRNAG